MDHAPGHVPVLIRQVVESLAPKPGETYLDCTAGLGGHAATIARSLAPNGTVVLNDMDAGNLSRAEEHVRQSVRGLEGFPVVTMKGNFAEAPRQMAERGLRADLVLADLGFSSNQVDDASRGLSFMRDGPLDMRLDASLAMSAGDLVRSASEAELARINRSARGDCAIGVWSGGGSAGDPSRDANIPGAADRGQ
jgi:16S rRNA (cytosine1402-N4)-methyltransferase